MASETESELLESLNISTFSKLRNPFVSSPKLNIFPKHLPLFFFFKFFLEEMSKALLDKGIIFQS